MLLKVHAAPADLCGPSSAWQGSSRSWQLVQLQHQGPAPACLAVEGRAQKLVGVPSHQSNPQTKGQPPPASAARPLRAASPHACNHTPTQQHATRLSLIPPPQGYGFCEYHDTFAAQSAVRNLSGQEVGGRPLRVDFAGGEDGPGGGPGGRGDRDRDMRDRDRDRDMRDRDRDRDMRDRDRRGPPPPFERGPGGPPPPGGPGPGPGLAGPGGTRPVGVGAAAAAAGTMAQWLGGPARPGPTSDAVNAVLGGLSPLQLYDLMAQMRAMITANPGQARHTLISNPQLTKALFQAQILLGMVKPPPGGPPAPGPGPGPAGPPPPGLPLPGGGPPPGPQGGLGAAEGQQGRLGACVCGHG